jgi:hypothetical protein
MATPDYAKDKNDLPLYTDQIGTEQLVIVAGNILDSANNVYIYDRVNDVLTNDATPANHIQQPPTGLRVREAQADAVCQAVREATAVAVAATTTTTPSPAPAPAPAPGAAPVTMALTPFVANTSTIDYQTKAGAELWKQSSKGLYGDSEELRYDLTAERLMSFLDDLTNRAKKCGWLVLMQISKDGVTKSMLTQYADIDREDAKTFLDTELDATTHPRKVQDDTALYHCLYDSLNIDARNRINLKKADFTLANNTESGVLLIKVITMAAQVATRSTATLLMSQLTAGMHQLYDKCGGNIIKFHETIRSKMRTLSSYGSPVGDKALIPALTSWSAKMCSLRTTKCYISGTKATHCISSCFVGTLFNVAGLISSVSTVKQ